MSSSEEENEHGNQGNQGNQGAPKGTPEKQFGIQKIYVKDLSFEAPHSPEVFTNDWRPDVNLNLSSEASPLRPDVYDVKLVITVTVKIGETTAFLVEIQQAGIFNIKGFDEKELGHMLASYCPSILFPYAREAVSDLVVRGGFPQFLLAPVNFDALYAQHLQQQAQQPQGAPQH